MAAKQGLNLVIESRDAEGKTERFGELAAELVRLKIDVIVASNPAATFAAKSATTSIPIVLGTLLIRFSWALSSASGDRAGTSLAPPP